MSKGFSFRSNPCARVAGKLRDAGILSASCNGAHGGLPDGEAEHEGSHGFLTVYGCGFGASSRGKSMHMHVLYDPTLSAPTSSCGLKLVMNIRHYSVLMTVNLQADNCKYPVLALEDGCQRERERDRDRERQRESPLSMLDVSKCKTLGIPEKTHT